MKKYITLIFLSAALICGCGTERKPDTKIMVFGIDGASWQIIGPLLQQHKLPNLEMLIKEGSSGYLRTIKPTASPRIWTSIFTGVTPKKHGIVYYTSNIDGVGLIPVSSSARKVPAIWNMLTENDMSSGIIGFWATWPAEKIKGFMISDHANFALMEKLKETNWRFTADPTVLLGLKQNTYPEDLMEKMIPHMITSDNITAELMRDQLQISSEIINEALEIYTHEPSFLSFLKFDFMGDLTNANIGLDLYEKEPPDFFAVYLTGVDHLCHFGWKYVEPEKFSVPQPELEKYAGVIPAYYIFMDDIIGRYLEFADENSTIVIVSDHGFEPIMDNPLWTGTHEETPPGIIIAKGRNIKKGHRIMGASVLNITPTLLYLMGLPLAENMDGAVLSDMVENRYRDKHPVKHISEYRMERPEMPAPSKADETMINQLKTLGYLN